MFGNPMPKKKGGIHCCVPTRRSLVTCLTALSLGAWSQPPAQSTTDGGQFRKIAAMTSPGGTSDVQTAWVDEVGRNHFFVGYKYAGRPGELVDFQAQVGDGKAVSHKLPNDLSHGLAAYQSIHSMVMGNDHKLYLATSPIGAILQYDPATQKFKVLEGDPLPQTDHTTFAWDLVVASNGVIYGCSYPGAALFRINPKNDRVELIASLKSDFGAKSEYARYIVSDKNGYVYVRTGISLDESLLYTYNTTGGGKPFLVSIPGHDKANVLVNQFYTSLDRNRTYASLKVQDQGSGSTPVIVQLVDGHAVVLPSMPNDVLDKFADAMRIPGLGKFSRLEHTDKSLKYKPEGKEAKNIEIHYSGHELAIFRLGLGPNNVIFGSGYLPAQIFKVENGISTSVGSAGPGEAYSVRTLGNSVVFGVYGGSQPLGLVTSGAKSTIDLFNGSGNSTLSSAWRAISDASSPDGETVWMGSQPAYETATGQLVEIHSGSTPKVNVYVPIQDRSISSLAYLRKDAGLSQNLLLIGTSLRTGVGSRERTSKAGSELLLWDPVSKKSVGTAVSPVSGSRAETIFDLCPVDNGEVFGLARMGDARTKSQFIAFVAKVQGTSISILRTKALANLEINPELTLNSIGRLNGKLYGLYRSGVFSIDPATLSLSQNRYFGDPVTAGFVQRGNGFYFGSGSDVVRFGLSPND